MGLPIDRADPAAQRQRILPCQPKSDAEVLRVGRMARVRRALRAMCVVAIEDAVQTIRCHTWSIILHRENRCVAVRLKPNR